MAANTSPIFTLTPVIGATSISVANAGKDGSGASGSVITGGTNGTRITRVTVQASGSTTAGMVRLFIVNSGSSTFLWREILVDAVVGSGSVAEFVKTVSLVEENALVLPSGNMLMASTENAEAFNIIAEGGDY